ncbi:helix-turn-helix transcriptional regulator [Paenibacillus thermotolerans]|uniref:helix-turn-helix transcriptional regulator n=1 Tax=Paenibacillus thermotolerans TaxID=3027807 RepID=UPI0023678E66|nr:MULTISPECIES: AraC family transcriptional regulator [unclassified Paenibacillus]
MITQENQEAGAASSKERTVRKLQEYILNHYRRNITIDELASIAEITPSYVTVLFKKVVGITPIQYMHHIRINNALHLLQNTQMSIGEIAEYLGYCDQAYFNRMFKKWMGTAPIFAKT